MPLIGKAARAILADIIRENTNQATAGILVIPLVDQIIERLIHDDGDLMSYATEDAFKERSGYTGFY